jgi:hypothetical protein
MTTSLSLRTSAACDPRRPGVTVTDVPPEPDRPQAAEGARIDLHRATESALIDLISRGSVPAFAALVDRTSDAVRAELSVDPAFPARANELLAATYLEVWWLAGCRPARGDDVTAWIIGIARRRIAEASRGAAQRTATEGPRPSYAELEIATLLGRPINQLSEDCPAPR